jgi:hypothetical protein
MRVYVYMADNHGCGWHRLGWASQYLADEGHDIVLVPPGDRKMHLQLRGDQPVSITMPDDCDVAVFQRVTNRYMAHALPLIRARGIAVVVDIDDDLMSIDPNNPAWHALHPRNEGKVGANGEISHHSWLHLNTAADSATLVTVSAPALARKYAPDHSHVIYNHLAEHYYGVEHTDSEIIGWPAALMSHPNDPSAVGNALARLVNQYGAEFIVTGDPKGVGRAFGLSSDPDGQDMTSVGGWPEAVAKIGIGIAPLAETVFNRSKSWLKPLEMSALGVPWVGSALPEYVRLNNYGAGLIAANPKQWFKLLRDLRKSPDMRAEYAGKGHEVAELFRMKPNAYKWLEAWQLAYDKQHS